MLAASEDIENVSCETVEFLFHYGFPEAAEGRGIDIWETNIKEGGGGRPDDRALRHCLGSNSTELGVEGGQ